MRYSLSLILFVMAFTTYPRASITYAFSGGRFGDCLVAYCHAKWLSYVYKIPLLYKPFKYSDQLRMHTEELPYKENAYARRVTLSKNNMKIDPDRDCLYVVPYFSENKDEHKLPWNKRWIYFKVNWHDPEFFKLLSSCIKPLKKITSIELPEDKISVALHVRKGTGFDTALLADTPNPNQNFQSYSDYYVPLKFPPEYFYIDQLKKISKSFHHKPLYVYIFTDDPHPEDLLNRFKEQLKDLTNIEFDYRKTGNYHDANVLEDFFSLPKFDVLIHPLSSFSVMAAKLASNQIQVYPTKHHWENHHSIIDAVKTIHTKIKI